VDTVPLRIDVWSDVVCPWCYIGKRHLEAALKGFPHADKIELVWRAFELDPSAPKLPGERRSMVDRIATKYRLDRASAQAQLDRVAGVGAQDGLELRFDRMQPGNTFDAHRLLHFAHELARQDALKERLFRAYMTDGQAISDRDVLVACARDVGLDEAAARDVLDGDRYTRDVRGDEALAGKLGITGVPFFVFNGELAVSGAQPATVLRAMLDRAWSESAQVQAIAVGGAACGPDGCS